MYEVRTENVVYETCDTQDKAIQAITHLFYYGIDAKVFQSGVEIDITIPAMGLYYQYEFELRRLKLFLGDKVG